MSLDIEKQVQKNSSDIRSLEQRQKETLEPQLGKIQEGIDELQHKWDDLIYGKEGVRNIAQSALDRADNAIREIEQVRKEVEKNTTLRIHVENTNTIERFEAVYSFFGKFLNNSKFVIGFLSIIGLPAMIEIIKLLDEVL